MNIAISDSVMRSDHNKKELVNVFCNTGNSPEVLMVGEANSVYEQEEADCNIISNVKSIKVTSTYKWCQIIQIYLCTSVGSGKHLFQ